MYKVVAKFKDLQDPNRHVYEVGDVFPHEGLKINKERISELASTKNRLKKILIEEVASDVNADGDVSGAEELVRPGSDKVARNVHNRKRGSDITGLDDQHS